MSITDLPYNINTGNPYYELEDPLVRLQTSMNERNVDVESLDERSSSNDIMFRGREPAELQLITGYIDEDPEQKIRSRSVKDLNDFFDKDLDTSDPNYIFRSDLRTRNNVDLIRQGNASFARDRDLYVVPPAVDTQSKILELLKEKKLS